MLFCFLPKRFVPIDWENCFDIDTYIQLPQIIEFPALELLDGGFVSKNISVINSLSSLCLSQLKNCLKQFRDDVSEQHWKLIFKS